jgi:hemoglobin
MLTRFTEIPEEEHADLTQLDVAKHHELAVHNALSDPVLKDVFTERVATHVDHLTWFTAESFGGPGRFGKEVGFQHIIDVHRHRKITDEQRDRFIALYLARPRRQG